MVKQLMRAFLRASDVVQYVEYIFSGMFDKVYNYSAIPKARRQKKFILGMPSTKPITEVEELDHEEMMGICDELLEVIVGSLVSMPQSVRYLLVLIKNYAIETVSLCCITL